VLKVLNENEEAGIAGCGSEFLLDFFSAFGGFLRISADNADWRLSIFI